MGGVTRALLEILKEMLPDDNELPKSTYDAKKILCPMCNTP